MVSFSLQYELDWFPLLKNYGLFCFFGNQWEMSQLTCISILLTCLFSFMHNYFDIEKIKDSQKLSARIRLGSIISLLGLLCCALWSTIDAEKGYELSKTKLWAWKSFLFSSHLTSSMLLHFTFYLLCNILSSLSISCLLIYSTEPPLLKKGGLNFI